MNNFRKAKSPENVVKILLNNKIACCIKFIDNKVLKFLYLVLFFSVVCEFDTEITKN